MEVHELYRVKVATVRGNKLPVVVEFCVVRIRLCCLSCFQLIVSFRFSNLDGLIKIIIVSKAEAESLSFNLYLVFQVFLVDVVHKAILKERVKYEYHVSNVLFAHLLHPHHFFQILLIHLVH